MKEVSHTINICTYKIEIIKLHYLENHKKQRVVDNKFEILQNSYGTNGKTMKSSLNTHYINLQKNNKNALY